MLANGCILIIFSEVYGDSATPLVSWAPISIPCSEQRYLERSLNLSVVVACSLSLKYKAEEGSACDELTTERLILTVALGPEAANKQPDGKQKTHMKLRRSLGWGFSTIYGDHEDSEALVCSRCQSVSASPSPP
jgi:hypothetical protein